MQNKTFVILFLIGIGSTFTAGAQQEGKYVRKGNRAYENGDYTAAAESYRKGVEENAYSYEANFNLGDAMYQQGEYESAAGQFDLLRQPGMDKDQLAKVYHNLGNSLLEQQKYAESIQAYKEALRNNPNDADTRYNLVYAMKKLQEQQQQQQNQDQNQEQNQDQQNQDQNQQDQENQDDQQNQQENQEQEGEQDQQNQQQQEQQEGQEKDQQQQGQQGQEKDQQQQQSGQPKDEISRQEAERILQALQMDENQLHEDMKKKKGTGKRVKILKEW